MSDEKIRETGRWLELPETRAAFRAVLTDFQTESDRGAVLIAAEMVSNHLDDTIKKLAPDFLKPTIRKLIEFSGVAGSFSDKAAIAALNGWIDEGTFKAITELRKLRNDAGHSNGGFCLKKERCDARLRNLLNFENELHPHIHRLAQEIQFQDLLIKLKDKGENLKNTIGFNPFETIETTVAEILKQENWSAPLELRLPRTKLGIGIVLIIWKIVLKRNEVEVQRNQSNN